MIVSYWYNKRKTTSRNGIAEEQVKSSSDVSSFCSYMQSFSQRGTPVSKSI